MDALIEWETDPPPVVKCAPVYERPEWVPWHQELKEKEQGKVPDWLIRTIVCFRLVI